MNTGVDATTRGSFFLNWDESFNISTAEVGGKGRNLGRLHRYGFPIPMGGVLSARAYRDFIHHNNLEGPIQSAATIKAEEVMASEEMLREIRRKIDEGDMSEAVVKELADGLAAMRLLDKPVAVRSSATAEDSVTASFAGVHESFLNILGLERICKAVKGCYASLWTPRAVAYRRRLGINDDEVATAVVIMELVSAEAAGVVPAGSPYRGFVGITRIWREMRFFINVLRAQRSADGIFKDMWETIESWKRLNFHTMTDLEIISQLSTFLAKTLDYFSIFLMLGPSSTTPLTLLPSGRECGRGHEDLA